MSTPYNVAQHLSQMLVDRSALALVDGQIWDMHRWVRVKPLFVRQFHFEGQTREKVP